MSLCSGGDAWPGRFHRGVELKGNSEPFAEVTLLGGLRAEHLEFLHSLILSFLEENFLDAKLHGIICANKVLIAECLSARQLILQCARPICIYIYIKKRKTN